MQTSILFKVPGKPSTSPIVILTGPALGALYSTPASVRLSRALSSAWSAVKCVCTPRIFNLQNSNPCRKFAASSTFNLRRPSRPYSCRRHFLCRGLSYKFRPVRCVNAPAASDPRWKTTGSGTFFASLPNHFISYFF